MCFLLEVFCFKIVNEEFGVYFLIEIKSAWETITAALITDDRIPQIEKFMQLLSAEWGTVSVYAGLLFVVLKFIYIINKWCGGWAWNILKK